MLCICDETAHIYMGKNLTDTHALPDETEFLERRKFPFEKALRMSLEGKIIDSMSVLGLALAAMEGLLKENNLALIQHRSHHLPCQRCR